MGRDTIKPILNTDQCIVLATDEEYVPVLGVMLRSLIETNSDQLLDIIILHDGISDEAKQLILNVLPTNKEYGDGIQSSRATVLTLNGVQATDNISSNIANHSNTSDNFANCNSISIRYFDCSELAGEFYTDNTPRITTAAYYRLFIPWILDDRYKRAIYFDCDMIVRKSIEPLMKMELDNNLIAAVRDYWSMGECHHNSSTLREWRESIGISNIDDYVISATLVFNLDEWRRFTTFEDTHKIAESKEWKQHDQDVINVLAQGRIRCIPSTWGMITVILDSQFIPENHYTELMSGYDDPAIRHFGGKSKPWNTPYLVHEEEFWHTAARTDFIETLLGRVRNYEYRNYIAMNLPGCEISFRRTVRGLTRYLKNTYMGVMEEDFFRIRNLTLIGDKLTVEGSVGYYGMPANRSLNVYVHDGNRVYTADVWDRNHERPLGISMRVIAFRCTVPLDNDKKHKLTITTQVGEKKLKVPKLKFDFRSPLGYEIEDEYMNNERWYIKASYDHIAVTKLPILGKKRFLKQLEQLFLTSVKYSFPDKYDAVERIRTAARNYPKRGRQLWLVSDRVEAADDNGEAIFRYIQEYKRAEVEAYFVLSRNSVDYERMKQYGHIVEPGSEEHRILVLAADVVVSSHSDLIFRNPFGDDHIFYRNMLQTPFAIAEHGPSYGKDFHSWFNRSNTMVDLLMVAGEEEREQYLGYKYEFLPDEVCVTGLPRFDYHNDDSKKLIAVMPTWRKNLAVGQDPKTGWWILVPRFEESEYAVFYRTLMTDKKLRAAADRYGYRIEFKIHPSFRGCEERFGFDDNVQITSQDKTYKEVFKEASLVVTDYSSTMYDFTYMFKPVIHATFDFDTISQHIFAFEEGFNYEEYGFGEVETTVEGTVDRIIEYMENGCQLKPEYRARVESFFKYMDQNNSERAFNAIVKMTERFR